MAKEIYMSGKNFKTLALSSIMALTGIATSCETRDDIESESNIIPEIVLPKLSDNTSNTQPDEKTIFFYHAFDSIYNTNGGKSYEDSLQSKPDIYFDIDAVKALEHDYTLGGTIDKRVTKYGMKIIDKCYQDLSKTLAEYNISLNEHIISDSIKFTKKYSEELGYQNEIFKDVLCFIGINLYAGTGREYYAADAEWGMFSEWIRSVISYSFLDPDIEDAAQQRTIQILDKAKQDLISSRKNIEKAFSDYYLLTDCDKQKLGVEPEYGELGPSYGYSELNNKKINGKYLITEQSVRVYDSKLTPEFFSDRVADYKLVSPNKYKWQVIKTYRDGTIKKTPVFYDNKEYINRTFVASTRKDCPAPKFEYVPGANIGVHVGYTESRITSVRKKDWTIKPPRRVQHKIDSLNNEIKDKQRLENLRIAARNNADSIAKILTIKEFKKKER